MSKPIFLFRDQKTGEGRKFNYIQKMLYNDNTRNKVIVLHRRCGKTSYACAKMVMDIVQNPHHRYWYVAPTYRQAKSIAWDMIKYMTAQFPRGLFKLREDELSVTCMQTKSKLELKGSDTPDSLRGAGLDGAVLDEYQLQDPGVYSTVVRPMLATTKGWCTFIGTPKGKNHFYDLYYMAGAGRLKGSRGESVKGWNSWLVKASESGIIDKEELDQIRREVSEDEYNQEWECDWLSFAGLIFKSFGIHNIVAPFKIPDFWEYGFALDHGATNPTSFHSYRIDPDGNVFVTGEYYQARELISYHALQIKQMMPDVTREIIADPSIFSKSMQSAHKAHAYSVADEYEEHGIINMSPGQNDVLAGIDRVNQYMQLDPERIHPLLNIKGSPRFFIIKGAAPMLEWEISNYNWKNKTKPDTNEPDQPVKVNDHACDEVRYFLMGRPVEATLPKAAPQMRTVNTVLAKHQERMKNIDYYGDQVPNHVRNDAGREEVYDVEDEMAEMDYV